MFCSAISKESIPEIHGYSLTNKSISYDDIKDDEDEIVSNIKYKMSVSEMNDMEALHIDITNISQDLSEVLSDLSFEKEISDALYFDNENEHKQQTLNKRQKKIKKKKKSKKNQEKKSGTSYFPNNPLRAQGNIQISKQFTEVTIPSTIRENICNLYVFMDKYTALCMFMDCNINNGFDRRSKVMNYGFHDRSNGEPLYCCLEKQDLAVNAARGYQWKMISTLYTAKDLKTSFDIDSDALPKSFEHSSMFKTYKLHQNEVQKILMGKDTVQALIKNTAWHRIDIFNKV